MLSALGRYVFISRVAARQQWAYRGELFSRALSTMLFLGIFVALWMTVFTVGGSAQISGYTLAEVVWYLAMTETITLSSSRVFMDISEAVKSGSLAYELTRPIPYPVTQIAHSLGNSAPRFVLNLVTAGLVVGLGVQSLAGSPAGFAAFLVLAWLALFLDALIAVLIGLLAFWIEDVLPIFWIYQKLLFTVGGLFLPLELFPAWLQRIARLLPFNFMAYAPARAFVAPSTQTVLSAALGQLVYIAVVSGGLWLVWRAAQRRLVVQGG